MTTAASRSISHRIIESINHSLLTRSLSPDAIINENYKYLKGFLEDLAPPERSALIQDWDTAGLVYLDYIRVIEMLDRIQQVMDSNLSVVCVSGSSSRVSLSE